MADKKRKELLLRRLKEGLLKIRMGAFLDRPKTDKETAEGEGNGLKYGVSSMQGWRIEMEGNESNMGHCVLM